MTKQNFLNLEIICGGLSRLGNKLTDNHFTGRKVVFTKDVNFRSKGWARKGDKATFITVHFPYHIYIELQGKEKILCPYDLVDILAK